MKRSISVIAIVWAAALLFGFAQTASAGQNGIPKPINLAGTTWVGTVIFVGTDGATEEATDATFEFKTQTDYYISGTFTASEGLIAPMVVNFSGTVGPVVRLEIHMTAENVVMSGNVVPMGRGKAPKLGFRGNDVLSARTFMGMLTKQVAE